MFKETDLEELRATRPAGRPVWSVYLNTDRATDEGRSALAVLRHLAKVVDSNIRQRFPDDQDAYGEYLQQYAVPHCVAALEREVFPNPTVRALAAFFPLGLGRRGAEKRPVTLTLPRPVRSQTHLDSTPHIRPLLYLLDQYERYAVIVVDRNHARFFTVFLGALDSLKEFSSDTPQRHHQGGWSQKRFQQRVDDIAAHHVHRVVRYTTTVLRHQSAHRLILSGDSELLHVLRTQLPKELRERIAGTFPLPAHAPLHTIMERSLALASEAERGEEELVVRALRDALAHPHRAAQGVEDTLRALTERRVQTLLVHRGFRSPGVECENCGTLLTHPAPCPHCRAATNAVEDIVERAIEQAYADRATVEFVTDNLDLEALGNIGAILRY